jgi:hypothetical protein
VSGGEVIVVICIGFAVILMAVALLDATRDDELDL